MSTTATPTGTGARARPMPPPKSRAVTPAKQGEYHIDQPTMECRIGLSSLDRLVHRWVVDPAIPVQYRQLLTSPPGGADLRSRSTILGANIW